MGPTSAAEKVQSDVARGRVLIADDDPLIRMDLAEMLTEEGFEVVGQVGDGERARSATGSGPSNWPGRCGRIW